MSDFQRYKRTKAELDAALEQLAAAQDRAETAERRLTSLLGGNWPELTAERIRAEAAEKHVAELEARLIGYQIAQTTTIDDFLSIAKRLGLSYDEWPGFGPVVEDIEKRIAELEARLAEQE